MVKKIYLIRFFTFFFVLAFAASLIAGEFTASVNSSQVQLGESFSLNLTLKGTSPKDSPAVSSLKSHFLIQSQQHATNTSILNGRVSSSTTWKLTLIPKAEGAVEIPAIMINTTEGLLSTQPITVNVMKGAVTKSNESSDGPNLIAKVSNASPYKNESLVYTALLTSKVPLYNVQSQKIQIEDAIVEVLEEPKLTERVIDGVQHNVVEFTYLITPLKTGALKIPSIVIQGATPQKRRGHFSSFFDDDDLDPIAFMQGFDRVKLFSLITEEIRLDVQPVVAEISPWLPAKTLTLEEQWSNDQTLRVGEPFSRGFVIKAEGVKASQLPNLEDFQSQEGKFKIYADKPETQEKLFQDVIHSMRKEQYTLIPQQAGTLVLPEISVAWWDSAKKQKKSSTIPARTVQILPALEIAMNFPPEVASAPSITTAPAQEVADNPPFLLYGMIGMLSFFLVTALLWGFILQRKIARLTQKPKAPVIQPKKTTQSPTAAQREKKERLPDLNPT